MLEDTGYDSYLCMYDVPNIPESYATKQELKDAQEVEFRKSFLNNFCKEM